MKDKFLKLNTFVDKYIYQTRLIYFIIFLLSLLVPTICLLYLIDVCFTKTVALVLMIILGLIDADLIIFNIIKREYKVEHIFASLILPIGLSMCLLMLPNFGVDEGAHAYRAYVISEGYILTDRYEDKTPKMVVPEQLERSIEIYTYNELGERAKQPVDYNKTIEVNRDGTTANTYFFLGYVFPALTFKIGKIFNINIFVIYYIARITNFLLFVLLVYYAIKLLPIGKYALLLLCLNPLTVQCAVTLTLDTLINALSFLLIACVLNKLFVDKKIAKKDLIIIGSVAILLSFMKYAYFPLIGSLLLLISKKNKKSTNISLLVIMIISMIVAIGSFLFFGRYYVTNNSYVINNGIDSAKQLSFIIHNPVDYLNVLLNTTLKNGSFYFFTLLGRNLSRYLIHIPEIFQVIYFAILIFSIYIEKSKYELSKISRLLFWAIFVGTYIIVLTGLYVGWSQTGAPIIEGIQGRYFLPIALLPGLCLIRKGNHLKYNKGAFILICTSLVVAGYTLVAVVKFFNI